MAFLSGSVSYERFRVLDRPVKKFSEQHLETLQSFAIGQVESAHEENVQVGFLAGEHLFDVEFLPEKNLLNHALHFGLRIDSHQIPAAIRKAWYSIELTAIQHEEGAEQPTKAHKQAAKEAVEARCEDEIRTGKYHRMQTLPLLWDARQNQIFIGSSSASALGHATDLLERAFEIELQRVTSGTVADDWAEREDRVAELEAVEPTAFHRDHLGAGIAWIYDEAASLDFLGNEFLLWLWWQLETTTDTFKLSDGSQVTAMLAKSLSLECPLGEHGKETVSAEAPTRLPEAIQAIRTGKWPRKAGLTLVRNDNQFDLALQVESLGVSSAKLQLDDPGDDKWEQMENRIDAVRDLAETIDLLFELFCIKRIGKKWQAEQKKLREWLGTEEAFAKQPAA